MPKNKFQEVIFTIMMVLVMVYAMICYNNAIFAAAFRELLFMAPLAFLLDFFLVSKIAFKKAYRIVNVKADNPFHLVLAISAVSVVCMCALMSLAATLLFKHAGSEFLAVWIQTTALNFPMAFFWQFFFAGPLVRFLFGLFFRFS